MLSVTLAVLAALANATSSVLQRKAARDEPEGETSGLRMMLNLARKPVWCAGIAAIAVGFLLQAGALATGAMSLVQPILVVELAFTLLLAAAIFHNNLHVREWAAIAGMTGGISLLLYSLQPSSGDRYGASAIWWAVGIVIILMLVATAISAGLRSSHDRRAAYFGIATGMGFGLTAALVSGITANNAAAGISGVVTGWQTYLLIVLGPGFFFLLQKTMQAGRLITSQPALTLSNPIVAVGFGIGVFGEHVRGGGWLAGAFLGAVLVGGCTALLARSPLLQDHGADSRASADQGAPRSAPDAGPA
ncbi:MAG: DMT family transporter [Nocardioidaceae bacterium]